jgi:hypothetical protein
MESLPLVRIRILRSGGALWRTGRLTPYLVETIVSDVRRAERVDVFIAGGPEAVSMVRSRLAPVDHLRIRILTRPRTPSGAAA